MFSLPLNAITDLSSSLRFISVFIVIGMDISSSLVVPSLTLALMFISIAILDSAEVFFAAVLNVSASAKNCAQRSSLGLVNRTVCNQLIEQNAVTALDIGIKRGQAHCNYVVTQEILGAAIDIVHQANLLTEIQCFGIGKIALASE